MNSTVYDTALIVSVNCSSTERETNEVLEKRFIIVEEFTGEREYTIARYNSKLISEYYTHIRDYKNDIINIFITKLAEKGQKAKSSTLRRQQWSKVRGKWPAHDRHLLAAAIDGNEPRIATTEEEHAKASKIIWKELNIRIIHL